MVKRSTAIAALLVLSFLFAANAAAQNPPTSRWVELGKPHLAKRGNGIVLVQAITCIASKDKFWALVEMNGSDETAPCDWLKTLEPKQSYRFECPVKKASRTAWHSAMARAWAPGDEAARFTRR